MGSLSSPRSDTDKHDVNHGDGFIKAEVVDQTIQGITFPKKVSCLVCAFLHTSFHVVSVGFEGEELIYFDIDNMGSCPLLYSFLTGFITLQHLSHSLLVGTHK